MKIHVLTLTWNALNKLRANSEHLFIAMNDFDWTWHLRDNGSKDETVAEFSDKQNVCLYDIGHNRDTFAMGMNYLFEKASPAKDDVLLLLNNDVSVGRESIKQMHSLMTKTKADVVGCRLLYNGTDKLQHAGVIFGPRYNNLPFHFRPGEVSDSNAEKDRYFQAVTAACCLVKASAWEAVGGMDEDFKWAFDDVTLCLSIKNNGGKIAYCGKTKSFHEESASLKKNPVNKMFIQHNVSKFKEKWSGRYDIDHDKYLKNSNYNVI